MFKKYEKYEKLFKVIFHCDKDKLMWERIPILIIQKIQDLFLPPSSVVAPARHDWDNGYQRKRTVRIKRNDRNISKQLNCQ